MRLSERLDRLPVLPFHWRLLALCGCGWILDSVDTGLLGFVNADLIQRWHVSKPVAGLVSSSGMVGLLVGAAVGGLLADRWGRRPLYVATPALFAAGSLLCGLAWSPGSLVAFRLLLGLALGAEFPVGTALLSEYAPARHRGRLMVLLDSFWAYGSVLAALSAYLLIPRFGWRVAFLVNVAPAVALALLRRSIPESPRYLLLRGRAVEAHATVASLEARAGLAAADGPIEAAPTPPRAVLAELLARPVRSRTLRLWVMWFVMTSVYVGLSSWLPAMLVDEGYALRESYLLMIGITLAQIPGYFTAALLIERWGRRGCLMAFTLAAGVCSVLFGRSAGVGPILFWGCLMSYFNLAAWGVLYAYTGEQFPTRLRGTGFGSCVALGRLGGAVSPLVAAAMLDAPGLGRSAVLALFGACLLVTCLGAWLGHETRGQSLEALHGA